MSLPSNQNNTKPPEDAPEFTGPNLQIGLDYFLSLLCHNWNGYSIIPRYLAESIKKADPLEEYHHIIDYGNEKLVKIYPLKVWRESLEKHQQDKEVSELGRIDRFQREEQNKVKAAQIQRKRDILSEVRADITKLYRSKGKDILSELGGGATWQIQVENVDYFLYRALSGKNESVRIKLGISQELALEFQELPEDTGWNNRKYQEDRELAKELGEM